MYKQKINNMSLNNHNISDKITQPFQIKTTPFMLNCVYFFPFVPVMTSVPFLLPDFTEENNFESIFRSWVES